MSFNSAIYIGMTLIAVFSWGLVGLGFYLSRKKGKPNHPDHAHM